MLALVDLCLCIHRILLHYLIKICVIIFLNICGNNLLLPAKPRLKKPSRVTLTYFDFCDLISQSPGPVFKSILKSNTKAAFMLILRRQNQRF